MSGQKITPSSRRFVSQNVLKYAKYTITYWVNDYPLVLHTPYPLSYFVSENAIDNPAMSSETVSLTQCEERLRTFNASEWKLKFVTPIEMAEAGFCYLGEPHRVFCTLCSTEFNDWQPDDDPLVEHSRKSPQCLFLNEKAKHHTVFDGRYTSPNLITVEGEIVKILETMDIAQKINIAKYKQYANFASRLETFNKCKKKMKQDTYTLCEAGFFYTGNGQNDHMSCFCCSQCIKDWEDDDEPWTTHARWSPTCSYLLLSKGKMFVYGAYALKSGTIDLENVSHVRNSVLFPEKNMNVNAVERKLDLPEPGASHKVGKLLSEALLCLSLRKDSSFVPDSILCKICHKEKMTVVAIPCGHIIACVQCTLTLNQCPVANCMRPFNMAMRVYVHSDEEQSDKDLNQLPSSLSQSFDKPLDPMLCKVCCEEKMGAVFLICGHICACYTCATKMNKCPVCSEPFCASMQVRGLKG